MPKSRDEVVELARSWLGVPWRHQGRNKLGIDCAGLVLLVAKEAAFFELEVGGYARSPDKQRFVNYFLEYMEQVPLLELKKGDVVLFRDRVSPTHCGIISEKHGVQHLIHAHALRKKVLEEPLQGEWSALWTHGFRFKGIE